MIYIIKEQIKDGIREIAEKKEQIASQGKELVEQKEQIASQNKELAQQREQNLFLEEENNRLKKEIEELRKK